MKDLSYLIKELPNKDESFWYHFLSQINRNNFVLEDVLDRIFKYFKIPGDVCILESSVAYTNFKCIYKNNDEFDDKLWAIIKRKTLIEVSRKNQLQHIQFKKKISGTDEIASEEAYVLPILTKESVYYLILNEFDGKSKSKYVTMFETLFCLFKICESNELLAKYSMIDTVTGCYNFNQFQKALNIEIAKTDRIIDKDVVFSVIYMDIKGLDIINDSYGYNVGDAVLKFVADSIESKIRKTDTVYRIGEDEFCVIASYAKKDVCTEFIVPRIIQDLNKKIHIKEDEYYHPKLNISVIEYKKGTTRNEFTKLMEKTLNEAKAKGEMVVV